MVSYIVSGWTCSSHLLIVAQAVLEWSTLRSSNSLGWMGGAPPKSLALASLEFGTPPVLKLIEWSAHRGLRLSEAKRSSSVPWSLGQWEQEVLFRYILGSPHFSPPPKKRQDWLFPWLHTKLWQVKFLLSTLFASLMLTPYSIRVLRARLHLLVTKQSFYDTEFRLYCNRTPQSVFSRFPYRIIWQKSDWRLWGFFWTWPTTAYGGSCRHRVQKKKPKREGSQSTEAAYISK